MRKLVLIACLGVVGCSSQAESPKAASVEKGLPRLESGDAGLIVNRIYAQVRHPMERPWNREDGDIWLFPNVKAGDELVVIEDRKADDAELGRWVMVRMTSGEHSGEIYLVERDKIRVNIRRP